MSERGPRGDGEFIWQAEITEIKSETLCRECGQGLVMGNAFVEDQRNKDKFHQGCANAVKQRSPIAAVYLRLKSWPAAKQNWSKIK